MLFCKERAKSENTFLDMQDEVSDYDTTMRNYFIQLLVRTKGRVVGEKGAALIAGINPSTFRFKCKKLSIDLKNTKY